MKKRRILIIATFPPPIHGSAIMSQHIKNSNIINDAFDCDYVNLSTSRKMDEIGKSSPVKMGRAVTALIKEFLLLLSHRYDLCYLAITCHGKGFLKDAPFALLCKLFCRKIVIHQHNKGMSGDVGRWPYRWLIPMVYKDAMVILLSLRLYLDIEKIVPKENVVVCPNGIPDICYEYKERNNPVPRILFLSNLLPSKGVYVLLDALKILKDSGVLFICDFVGGETNCLNKNKFEEEINKRNLNRMVVYHGCMCGEGKERMYEQSDVFTFPSLDEAFGLVNLEAMMHNLPIVATDEGGIPDIVKDGQNGFLCERNNAEDLAKSLQRLIENPDLRKKMGLKGKAMFDNNYTVSIFERNLKKIMNQIIDDKDTNAKN